MTSKFLFIEFIIPQTMHFSTENKNLSCLGRQKRFLFWRAVRDTIAFGALTPCGIAAAEQSAKNSPPDCFLNAACPLRVRAPPITKEKRDTQKHISLFWRAVRDTIAFGALTPCGIAAAEQSAKNSPPDCFLYAACPLRVRVPFITKEKRDMQKHISFFWRAVRDSNPRPFGS